jgi:hypothetical protein
MAQWYGVKKTSDGHILSYTSDDIINLAQPPNGTTYQGPFATQAAAQAALEPATPSASQTVISNLMAKASATWTLQDVADFLKNK